MFGELATVGPETRLIRPEDAERIIAAVDARMQPCSKGQAATLAAEIIACYPALAMQRNDPSIAKDFQLYAVKLIEAFAEFSYEIGKAAVHGGTGIPSKVQFKPQPSDVVSFCTRERDRRLNVKTMAERHKAEAERREREKAEAEHKPDLEARKRQVAELLGVFRENTR